MTDGTLSLRWLGMGFPLLLLACAHELPVDGRPDRVWASPRGLEAAKACAIRALDEFGRTQTALAPSVTHAAQTIAPGKIYEIRPRQRGTTGDSYFLRLEKIDDHITRMSFFVSSPWKKQMIAALAPCGRR